MPYPINSINMNKSKIINAIIVIGVVSLYAISVGYIIAGISMAIYSILNGYLLYPLFVSVILFSCGVSLWLTLQRQ